MAEPTPPPSTSPPPPSEPINLIIHHHGKPYPFTFPPSSTIHDLSITISTTLQIPPSSQKFLITPQIGILKPPFPPKLHLSTLHSKKIQLLATTPAEAAALSTAAQRHSAHHPPSPQTHNHNHNQRKTQADTTYTFTTLLPLPNLPSPARSLHYLQRLRDDPGIRTTMRTHRFRVPILTEMNPADHTTHDSRTLGLNRNRGEVIELRLRTDAYDGYRDYKTIRKTLCHELAHNVYGDHDRDFWNLCREIEREVERNDWRSGGRALSSEEFYDPGEGGEELEHVDEGWWTGGEFVLGSGPAVAGANAAGGVEGLTRREIMARAAEERGKRQKEVEGRDADGEEGTGGSG